MIPMDADDDEGAANREFDDITLFLEKQFGSVKCDNVAKTVVVSVDGMKAKVDCREFVSPEILPFILCSLG